MIWSLVPCSSQSHDGQKLTQRQAGTGFKIESEQSEWSTEQSGGDTHWGWECECGVRVGASRKKIQTACAKAQSLEKAFLRRETHKPAFTT